GILEPLTKLPAFKRKFDTEETAAIIGMLFRLEFRVLVTILSELNRPELQGLLEKLNQVGREQQKLAKESAEFTVEMTRLGCPSGGAFAGGTGTGSGTTFAPFDNISDRLRGMRGTMLDMYRYPDKLLTACDKLLNWEMSAAVPAKPDARGNPVRAGMPLHRGSDGFMSKKDFEKFYWPTLKKAIEMKIKLGYTVTPFWEGIWDDRLEYLLDFPKGKVVFYCEKTDVFKAKEVLGGHMCIQGGVPPTLLQVGSPQDVEEHCKKLIKVVGKDGGFILSAGSSIDYAKPANIKAMVDTVKKYGRY
ncbi:MAG: uroporphyrinogen decarboxylase family protein, partial [Chloroflexota bacterium]